MKFIIKYNYGYGEMIDECDADNLEDAKNVAYQVCEEEAQSSMDWNAMTVEDAIEQGYIEDPEDE